MDRSIDRREQLLDRLNAIARSLEQGGKALALLGMGSVGRELNRIDAYSDLDFFVIVTLAHQPEFLDSLDWLAAVHPIAFAFRNTADGYKALFEDGILCEFAVLTPEQLPAVPFAPGRVVWTTGGVDESIAMPGRVSKRWSGEATIDWKLGEAITNLYVGLQRHHRGERLSATRFIQGHAVDRLLELAPHIETGQPGYKDPFAAERRFEQRFPQTAALLPHFIQGYERNVESALAILAFLEQHFDVNPAMARAIRALCHPLT